MCVVDRHRRRAVLELRVFVRDEGDAPLAVEVHRDLARLERVRGRELVAEAGLEARQLAVAVPVDEALVPGHHLRPRGILREVRLAVRGQPLDAEGRAPALGDVLVEADQRVDAGDLDRAVRRALRQLLRVRRQLGDRLRWARDPRLREQRLVVVEAVGVGEQRQRAPLPAVLRVVAGRRREPVDVDVILLQVGRQVDPGAAAAVVADVVGVERADDVGRRSRADRGDDLRVVDVADDLDLGGRVALVVLVDQRLERLELVGSGAPPDPRRERHRLRRRALRRLLAAPAAEATGERQCDGEQDTPDRDASHVDPPDDTTPPPGPTAVS